MPIELEIIVITKDITLIMLLFVMHTSVTLMLRFWCICLWCPISNALRLTGENINSRNFSFMYMPTWLGLEQYFYLDRFIYFINDKQVLNRQVLNRQVLNTTSVK